MTRRQVVEQALAAHGITDPDRLKSHVDGCDLTHPVTVKRLHPGDRFDMWVRDAGTPGKYAAPEGEDPAGLGIIRKGRHLQRYRVVSELDVVSCTAKTFPSGKVEGVGGLGGNTQYILPPDWSSKVERVL